MISAILAALTADTTLTALLPGGLHDGRAVGEVARDTTPTAFDSFGELHACGLLQPGGDVASGPLPTSSRLSVTIYLYERAGVAHIEPARLRIYALLHQAMLTPASGGAWELGHVDDLLGRRDDALHSALILCRYRVFIRKG
jgi:hypothetical protein